MKQFESFGLDVRNECLWRGGEQIALPPRTFAVLRYLVENPGRLISHDELLDKLWPETYVQPQVLRTYMLELRKVLGDDARQPRFIRSQPKRGYVFVAAVREEDRDQGSGVRDQKARELEREEKFAADHAVNHGPNHAPPERKTSISVQKNPAGILVGRDREWHALNACVERLAEGARQVVLLCGDPGMGKTTLLDAFCGQFADSAAAVVARGQCVEGIGAREQYYPVMEALAALCAGADGERACEALARIAPEWLPGAHRRAASGSVGDLCAALEELAADRPLILVLEDIHWADASTLEALSALARRRGAAQLMIVATFSKHYMAQDHPLRALRQDLKMRHLCEEVVLAPLRREHAAALLRMRLGQQELPEGLDAYVQEHAEGNPLFVYAILDHLIAERFLIRVGVDGADMNGAVRWEERVPFQEMQAGIPDELAQRIELEIGRLAAVEQRLLEAASLIDVAFPAWAVAAALAEEVAETEEALDALARRVPFLHRAGHDEMPGGASSAFYAFAHRLYREVLYQRQSAATRARRHTRVAGRLGELFAGREFRVAQEMAKHLEAAGNLQQAIDVLCTAANEEKVSGSHILAEDHLRRALGIAANLPEDERVKAQRELEGVWQGLFASEPANGGRRNPKRKQLQQA